MTSVFLTSFIYNKSKLNVGNACYHSTQNLCESLRINYLPSSHELIWVGNFVRVMFLDVQYNHFMHKDLFHPCSS